MNIYEEEIEFRDLIINKLLAELEHKELANGTHPGTEWEMQFIVSKDRPCWVKKLPAEQHLVGLVNDLIEKRKNNAGK